MALTIGNEFVTLSGRRFVKSVEIFRTQNGNAPFLKWIESLDMSIQAKIFAFIDMVARGGSRKNIKAVGSGVFEIKINVGSGYRVYFGEIQNVVIVLLCGGDKGTQYRDIKRAKALWCENV